LVAVPVFITLALVPVAVVYVVPTPVVALVPAGPAGPAGPTPISKPAKNADKDEKIALREEESSPLRLDIVGAVHFWF
jgi:hypothetical protein